MVPTLQGAFSIDRLTQGVHHSPQPTLGWTNHRFLALDLGLATEPNPLQWSIRQ